MHPKNKQGKLKKSYVGKILLKIKEKMEIYKLQEFYATFYRMMHFAFIVGYFFALKKYM